MSLRTLRRWFGAETHEDRYLASIERSNLVASAPDERDYRYIPLAGELPREVDLGAYTGPILDQLSEGSCVGHAVASPCELMLARAGQFRRLSPAFPYYNSRELEGRIGQQGTSTRNGLKVANKLGICNESTWPYVLSKINTRPSESAYAEALTQRLDRYERIYHYTDGRASDLRQQNIRAIHSALAEGCPVVLAFMVGDKFRYLRGPVWEQQYEQVGPRNPYIGNHALVITGYRWGATPEGVKVENSWSARWGDNGFGRLPWSVIGSDIIEAWAVRGYAGTRIVPPPGITLRELTRYYLRVRIVPETPGPTNLFVGAVYAGKIYLHDGTRLVEWSDGPMPVYKSNVVIDGEHDEVIASGIDLNLIAGADVYVGYGYPFPQVGAKVCTIPAF